MKKEPQPPETVIDHNGKEVNIKDMQKSLRVNFPSYAMKNIDDWGTPYLTNVVYSVEPCLHCSIEGNGTLQFPLRTKFCQLHANAGKLYQAMAELKAISPNSLTSKKEKNAWNKAITALYDATIPPVVSLLIILLFPVLSFAQSGKIQLRKQIAPAALVFAAGMADGLNQLTTYHYKDFKHTFPGANDQYWYAPMSFSNKYRNHDPAQGAKFPGSRGSLVFLTDGYHLTRFCERLLLSGAFAFKIVQGEKMKWYWYIVQGAGYLFINRLGFCAVYNTIK